MNQMLCGYRDDPRQWSEPDTEEEDNDPRTEQEKRISWICDDWADALKCDNYDEWRDVRMSLYGARQALVNLDRYDKTVSQTWDLLNSLGDLAFEYGMDCIRSGEYEGAKP